MGFFRQEYWSGLAFPPPGDLPHPGIKPASLVSPALQVASLPLEPLGKPVPPLSYFKSSDRIYFCTLHFLTLMVFYSNVTTMPLRILLFCNIFDLLVRLFSPVITFYSWYMIFNIVFFFKFWYNYPIRILTAIIKSMGKMENMRFQIHKKMF